MMHIEPSTTIMISELENGYVIAHKVKKEKKENKETNGAQCLDMDSMFEETNYIANTFDEALILLKDLLGEAGKNRKEKKAIPSYHEEEK